MYTGPIVTPPSPRTSPQTQAIGGTNRSPMLRCAVLDGSGVEAVRLRGGLGVAQEARVNPGVAQGKGLAVDSHRAILQRTHEIVCGVHEREQVAPVVPTAEPPEIP